MKSLRQMAVAGLVTISLFVAYNNFVSVSARWNPDQPFINSVDDWEKRIKPVKDYIPDDVTQLGYVADWNIPNSGSFLADQETEYILTQYVLAPRTVHLGLDHEWIIGNFLNPDFKSWLDQSLSSYEIKRFGFGIHLIHRIAP